MIPILYKATETLKNDPFRSMGLGPISECSDCLVTEELNGKFELKLGSTVLSKNIKDFKVDNIILAQPRGGATPEPFRISKVSVLFNGTVNIEAQHISYQLNYILANGMDKTFRNNTVHSSPPVWFNEFIAHRVDMSTSVPFTLTSDITDEPHKMETWDSVLSFKSLMQGREGSLLDLYGGEFSYSFYTVSLNKRRGRDKKFRVVYGENMQSMTYSDDIKELYTGAVGFWHGDNNGVDTYVQGDMIVTDNAGDYAFRRIAPLDFSLDFDSPPTVAQLNQKTRSHINSNRFGVPEVQMQVKVVSTHGEMVGKDDLEVGDTIEAIYTPAGIRVPARVSSVVYDVLREKNKEVVIGKVKKKASSLLAKLL